MTTPIQSPLSTPPDQLEKGVASSPNAPAKTLGGRCITWIQDVQKQLTQRIVAFWHNFVSCVWEKNRPLPEILALLFHCGAYVLDMEKLDTEPDKVNRDQVAVLFVHGYLDRAVGWFDFRANLMAETGAENVYSVNLGHPFQNIEHYAQVVRAKIEHIKRAGCKEVILVAHSMGGFVSREYRQKYADQDGVTVPLIVTLGTPLHGANVLRFASLFSPAAKEMLPGSSFIMTQEDWEASNRDSTQYVHVVSKGDLLVPGYKALHDLKHGLHENIVTQADHGHMALQMSDEINKIVFPKIVANLQRKKLTPTE